MKKMAFLFAFLLLILSHMSPNSQVLLPSVTSDANAVNACAVIAPSDKVAAGSALNCDIESMHDTGSGGAWLWPSFLSFRFERLVNRLAGF